mmetsp:Transcript_26324/g.52461  ORF Transcript_26324/g.52461 Transcript_26324/m.52461 type:complete len:236 (-) Transcript_26324:446-1153(-)
MLPPGGRAVVGDVRADPVFDAAEARELPLDPAEGVRGGPVEDPPERFRARVQIFVDLGDRPVQLPAAGVEFQKPVVRENIVGEISVLDVAPAAVLVHALAVGVLELLPGADVPQRVGGDVGVVLVHGRRFDVLGGPVAVVVHVQHRNHLVGPAAAHPEEMGVLGQTAAPRVGERCLCVGGEEGSAARLEDAIVAVLLRLQSFLAVAEDVLQDLLAFLRPRRGKQPGGSPAHGVVK